MLTDDRQAFLDAIADAPTDDVLRFVYADYLAEQGDAAAEFEQRRAGHLIRVRREPDDDTPRLVFADWLEEVEGYHAPCPDCSGPCRGCGGRSGARMASNARGKRVPMCRACWRAERKSLSRHHGWRWGQCRACSGEGRLPTHNAERAAFIRAAVRRGDDDAQAEFAALTSRTKPFDERFAFGLDDPLWQVTCLRDLHEQRLYRWHVSALTVGGFVGEVVARWPEFSEVYESLMASPWAVLRRVRLVTLPPIQFSTTARTLTASLVVPGCVVIRTSPITVKDEAIQDGVKRIERRLSQEVLGGLFPGRCPNHPIQWGLPGDY